jgi:hypothetical protein
MLSPNINFKVSQQSEPRESGLSQGLESHYLSDYSSQDTVSLQKKANSELSRVSSRDIILHTSVSKQINKRVLKKARKKGLLTELY